jgi:peptidoglycan/xylan/chitin deacetylase (PgdA/CDA1 family)
MSGPRVASLLFHDVTDHPSESGFQRAAAAPYRYTTGAFDAVLEAIARSPFRPALVTEVDFSAVGSALLLTFDDGGKSAQYIGERLAARGWRGHFLVTTSLIDTPTFLSKQQIREVHTQGHIVGSHSHSHPNIFRDLTWEQMLEEWSVSRAILAEITGQECSVASVPGGDSSHEVWRSASNSGIRFLFTSDPSLSVTRVDDCRVLGRVCPKAGTPIATIEQLVNMRGWHKAALERKIKGIVRQMAAPLYRAYVQRTTR